MANAAKRIYPGMTNSIRRRVREHELNLTPRFAAKCNITRRVYFESFEDVRNAIEREKQIKAWTGAQRIALIESTNPKWNDLSREWQQPETFWLRPQDRVRRGGFDCSAPMQAETQDPSLRAR
jgi:putative endonuclease